MNILKQADLIVNERAEEKDRMYGPFSETMERAASIFNLISPKSERITTQGMYRALIALKLSREAYHHKEDNLLDAAAYIGALNNYIEENKDDNSCKAKKSFHKSSEGTEESFYVEDLATEEF